MISRSNETGDCIKALTPKVVTLWYRAPEILLGEEKYNTAVDIWSAGCVFAEMVTNRTLMPGKGDMEQLKLIFDLLGVPDERVWPGFYDLPGTKNLKHLHPTSSKLGHQFKHLLSPSGLDLLHGMLCYDPAKRITAQEALNHKYFREHPLPQESHLMRTFASTNTPVDKKRERDEEKYVFFDARIHEQKKRKF